MRNVEVLLDCSYWTSMILFLLVHHIFCKAPCKLNTLVKFCWLCRFDVAGAGACLKRYTDPSFFKPESADFSIKKSEGQREKRIRKVKVLRPTGFSINKF